METRQRSSKLDDSIPLAPGARAQLGLSVGLLCAAATSGALVGLGLRHDTAFAPFESGGRALLATWHLSISAAAVAIGTGAAAHTIWMVLWGVCFSVAAARLRGLALASAAIVFVVLLHAVAVTFLPGALGASAYADVNAVQTALLLALQAGALGFGLTFAKQSTGDASRLAAHPKRSPNVT